MRRNLRQFNLLVTILVLLVVPVAGQAAGSMTSSDSSDENKKDKYQYGSSAEGRFGEAEKLIAMKNYAGAYLLLSNLPSVQKDEADRQNLLGFTARKHGQLRKAAMHYETALSIDPQHRGALEYQGELFLKLGQPEKAIFNLGLLKKQCWISCSERTKLQNAIDSYNKP